MEASGGRGGGGGGGGGGSGYRVIFRRGEEEEQAVAGTQQRKKRTKKDRQRDRETRERTQGPAQQMRGQQHQQQQQVRRRVTRFGRGASAAQSQCLYDYMGEDPAQRPALTNCVSCGLITPIDEEGGELGRGVGECPFCGAELLPVLSEQQIWELEGGGGAGTGIPLEVLCGSAEQTLRAYRHKDKLQVFDKEATKRTKVLDAQADYYQAAGGAEGLQWLSQEEKQQLEAREEARAKKVAQGRSRRPVTVAVDVEGRRVVDVEEDEFAAPSGPPNQSASSAAPKQATANAGAASAASGTTAQAHVSGAGQGQNTNQGRNTTYSNNNNGGSGGGGSGGGGGGSGNRSRNRNRNRNRRTNNNNNNG